MGNPEDDLIDQLEQGATAVAEKSKDTNQSEESLAIGEGKEPNRPELVCREDILKVVEMDKMGLQKYTDSRLGKRLDLSKRLKMLRTEVVLLIKNKLEIPTDTNSSNVNIKETGETRITPEYIFNPKNRRVFEWTELLAKRTDLIECWLIDEEGKRL
jgi:hypothetical protein